MHRRSDRLQSRCSSVNAALTVVSVSEPVEDGGQRFDGDSEEGDARSTGRVAGEMRVVVGGGSVELGVGHTSGGFVGGGRERAAGGEAARLTKAAPNAVLRGEVVVGADGVCAVGGVCAFRGYRRVDLVAVASTPAVGALFAGVRAVDPRSSWSARVRHGGGAYRTTPHRWIVLQLGCGVGGCRSLIHVVHLCADGTHGVSQRCPNRTIADALEADASAQALGALRRLAYPSRYTSSPASRIVSPHRCTRDSSVPNRLTTVSSE